LHSCDGRYAAATGDQTVRAHSRDLRWLIGAVSAAAMAWKMTGAPMKLGLGITPVAFTFYPAPVFVPIALTAAAVLIAARLAYQAVQRARRGLPFPKSHALIGGMAMANLIGSALIPNDQFFLTLALVASCHNMQYFAFCYTHHHLRAAADATPNDLYTRWAREGKVVRWFVLPFALGVAYGVGSSLLPPLATTCLLTWFMVSHYFVDANIWRRKYYPLMGRFASRRIDVPAEPVAPAAVDAVASA
jgi:hypothetical protein